MAVDHPRQQMQAAAVDHLTGMAARKVADSGKAAGFDAKIAQAFAVLVDDGAAFEDQVIGFRHIRTGLKYLSAWQQTLGNSAYVSPRVLARDLA